MYHLLGASFLKSLRPFLTKSLTAKLPKLEFILLHTLATLAVVAVVLGYQAAMHGAHRQVLANVCALDGYHVSCIVGLALMTVASSWLVLEAYQFVSSALAHAMLMRSITVIMLVVVGMFLFDETYTYTQLFGVALIVVGMVLLNDQVDVWKWLGQQRQRR
jgi:multidrug transporter EmrE-like cation transporter